MLVWLKYADIPRTTAARLHLLSRALKLGCLRRQLPLNQGSVEPVFMDECGV